MAGIYVHIPFCASRCIYCDFYSSTGLDSLQDYYVDALIRELNNRKNYLGEEKINTIYIGGGTPSLLTSENLMKLCDALYEYAGHDIIEFTIECNPDDVSPTLAHTIEEWGINRVSMGVQTFSDERLSFLRRRHKSADAIDAVSTLRSVGIQNISIDLMFGFPGETLEEWSQDIDRALALNVEHLSAYSLMYEKGTLLFRMLKEGRIEENDENVSRQMYELLIDKLTAVGYTHYEISNFAKDGHESIHNSSYWNGTKYLGLGAGAHSYDGESRQWNICDVKKYIKGYGIPEDYEQLDSVAKYNDLITTALRTRRGIDLSKLSIKERAYIIRSARKSIDNGLLLHDGDSLCLTREGLYVSDDVMSDLIYVP